MIKRPSLLIGIICACYVALRLWRLADSCLWFDEIFSVHAAEQSWGALFWFVAQDIIHPPLFYILLKLWIAAGDESLLWLRLLPVMLSVISLIPFLYLCRELKLKAPAILLTLTFFAASGSLIKYAQEVRMYSLLFCLSLFSLWLFTRFFYRGKNIWILTLVNILLVYTHYFGWLVVISQIATILILQRIKIRHVLIMLGIALITYVPWIIAIAKSVNHGFEIQQNIGWIARPDLAAIFDFAFDLIEPFYFQQSNADDSTKLFITLPLLAIIVAAKLIYFVDWKRQTEWDRMWLLSIVSVVPLLLAFALSWVLPVSLWGSRHLIFVFAPMMIVVAIFVTEVAIRPVRYLFVSAIAALIVVSFILQVGSERPTFIWCAWERLATQIPDDRPQTVYAFEDITAYHLWFATRNASNINIVKVNDMPGMTEDKAYFLPRGFDGVRRINAKEIGGEQFWIAFRDLKWNEKHPPLNVLLEKDYKIGNPYTSDGQGVKGFLAEVKK